MNVETGQSVPGPSVRLGPPVSEPEAGLSNKRRKTAKNTSVTVRAGPQKVSVQIATSGSNGSSSMSSASSVAHGREEIDTPTTTISTGSVGRGKRMLKSVAERLGGAEDSDSVLTTRRRSTRVSRCSRTCFDSDGEEEGTEEHGEDTADESEEEDFQPYDSDEYADVEEELSTSRRWNRSRARARARAAPTASSSSSTRLRTIDFDGDSELSDVPDTEMEDEDGEVDDVDDDEDTGATVPTPSVLARAPRYRRGGGMSRVS